MSKWAIQQFLSTVSILTDTVNVTVINYTQWSGQTNLTTALVPDLSFPLRQSPCQFLCILSHKMLLLANKGHRWVWLNCYISLTMSRCQIPRKGCWSPNVRWQVSPRGIRLSSTPPYTHMHIHGHTCYCHPSTVSPHKFRLINSAEHCMA